MEPSATAATPTAAQLFDFVRAREGTAFATLYRDRTFRASMRGDRLYVATANGEREVRSTEEVLELFASSGSFRPGAYRVTKSFNASYLLALIAAFQGRSPGAGVPPDAGAAPAAVMSAQRRLALTEALRAVARLLDCSINEKKLTYGLALMKKGSVKEPWIGSIYWGRNHPSNDVEIAIDLLRLANRPGKAEPERLRRWFRHTVQLLENEPALNHSGDHLTWFRAGFTFDDAMGLFAQMAKQTGPLLHDHERWVVTGDEEDEFAHAEGSEPGESDHGAELKPSETAREQASIDHMFDMAKQACAASGKVNETINKIKEIKFASDDELRQHIGELIERQGGVCAVTELPLHFKGSNGADEELLASLDRIDSNGHYMPGNLQIVCRFANRWKSDDDNDNFMRLIRLLKQQAPSAA